MKIGLVHGRFQPFHNGHKFLIDKMLRECDLGVVLVGSPTKKDKSNIFDLASRQRMIRSVYKKNKRILIGANLDLDNPYSSKSQWDVVFASAVLSLSGFLPTHVYTSGNNGIVWKRVQPKIIEVKRYRGISGTSIRALIKSGRWELVRQVVPKEVFAEITPVL